MITSNETLQLCFAKLGQVSAPSIQTLVVDSLFLLRMEYKYALMFEFDKHTKIHFGATTSSWPFVLVTSHVTSHVTSDFDLYYLRFSRSFCYSYVQLSKLQVSLLMTLNVKKILLKAPIEY